MIEEREREEIRPDPPPDDVAIRLQNVELRYDQKVVLSDCSLDCKRGKVTGIIGLSGAGKSTILRVANGLRRPTRGYVFTLGQDIGHMTERDAVEVRKRMGMAFQYNALFDSMTVAENVAYPLHEHTKLSQDEIDDRVDAALESVGLADVGRKMPAELSGGMQKRAGFARAIVNDPQIILFDEPTTGLDPIMIHVIRSTIRRIQERLRPTSVVVSHDLESVFAVSDEVALLFEGVIIEAGTTQSIRQSPNPIVQQFLQGSEVGPIPL
jgi:phospholipid/cholesterol/gamma-HCH transport system ATP-binding protein